MKLAFYNEIDAECCARLSNLMDAGLITPGKIDDRSISNIRPDELVGFDRAHFFAGIGGWELAINLANWPDDRPVWTGSCPCQPFSIAGAGAGFDDERHLWPDWFWLISQCRPGIIFGEQVESPDARVWLDLVSADLEGCDYACGPLVFPSAGVGAPNIRHRLWWVANRMANASGSGRDHQPGIIGEPAAARKFILSEPDDCGRVGRLADPESGRRREHGHERSTDRSRQDAGQSADCGEGAHGRLGDAGDARLPHPEPSFLHGKIGHNQRGATEQSGGPRHPWRELEWLQCTDGKLRPTQPGLFPLAPRLPGDVARLRGAGNAINPIAAAEVIRAYMDLSR